MSSIADLARSIVRPSPWVSDLIPPTLAEQLATAESELPALLAAIDPLALDVAQGVPGSSEPHIAAVQAVTVQRQRIDTLRRAVAEESRVNAVERQKAAQAAREAALDHVASILAQRDEAAEKLSEALSAAVNAYSELVELSRQAGVACPSPIPLGSLVNAGSLRAAVEYEAYRLGHVAGWPGGRVEDQRQRDNPRSIQPIAARMRDGSRALIASQKTGA